MAPPPRIAITIDCPDPGRSAAFWASFLGYEQLDDGGDGPYVTITKPTGVDGVSHLTFQEVPEAKVGKARAHLDLFVDHAFPMVDEMVAAGATLLSTTEAGEWTTRILQDPAGHEFCVIGPD
ncbi:MAG: VOC family protein [Acidimicrobiales bacterium]